MAHIFISYSHDDREYAHRLAQALERQGLSVWIDDRIDYGTRWLHEIETHIDGCSALIVVMTPRSKESDWVQSEWLYARDRKKPIYALLLDGEAWLAFRSTQYADVRGGKLPPVNFYTRLKTVDIQIATPVAEAPRESMPVAQKPIIAAASAPRVTETPVSDKQTWGGVEFVRIPAGKFLMGSKDDNILAFDSEKRQHTVEIPYDYWMARYPVTNEQFEKFIEDAAYKFSLEKNWKKKADHPVAYISWHDAQEYCRWLNTLAKAGFLSQGLVVRLPTEAEWEKAARGVHGNEWPWDNEFDKNKCNSSEGGKGGTTPVGAYSPQGDSPYGVADMAGNVYEWCHSLFKPYPYTANDGREDKSASGPRVLRGGSFFYVRAGARCAGRLDHFPDLRDASIGFRVVVSPGF